MTDLLDDEDELTTQLDYWCSQGLVITVEGPESRQRVVVDKPFARLGSHESSEVVIPGEGFPRQAFYFHATDDGVFCVDIDRDRSAESRSPGWLSPDDCIKLGPCRVWAELSSTAAGESMPRDKTMADLEAIDTAAEPQPILAMSINGTEISRRALTRELTVLGRRSPSKLRVTSSTVSVTHCVFYWKSGVLWVIDLLSINGTRLHGRRIEVARFSPTVYLQIGLAEFHRVDMPEMLPDGSSSEAAESLALAVQRRGFDAEVAAWNDRQQVVAAESATRKSQLDEMASAIEKEKSELVTLHKQAEDERRQAEAGLADQARQRELLMEQQAELESGRRELDTERDAWLAEQGRRESECQEQVDELSKRQEAFLAQQKDAESRKPRAQEQTAGNEHELAQGREDIEEQMSELAAARDELSREREAWQLERRSGERALDERARQLAHDQAEFLLQREEWASQRRQEEEKPPQRPDQDPPGEQLAAVEPEVALPSQAAAAEPSGQSAESDSLGGPVLSYLHGGPKLAAIPTIRRGPRWTPADHRYGLRPNAAAFWARAIVVAVACSVIAGMAVRSHLAPAYTITVQTGDDVYTDDRSPEDIIKSNDLLSEVLAKVDDPTFSEISRRGDPVIWLRDELEVRYSGDTDTVRVGLRGTQVSDLSAVVDTVAEAFRAELNLPPTAIFDRETVDSGNRLKMMVLGTALGLFVPIVLAAAWRRSRSASRPQLPQDSAPEFGGRAGVAKRLENEQGYTLDG